MSTLHQLLRAARPMRLLVVLAALLTTAPAVAQVTAQLVAPPAPPVGLWQCTVNSAQYGLELEMEIAGDGTLYARGLVIYYGLQNPFTEVAGFGDWSVLPPDQDSDQYLFKFRMFPEAQNHPIVTWYARPAGTGIMYNVFHPPGTGDVVETQCSKFG